jgi:aspartyl-tRNA(Asn)/glutamyl-tRNA(Gln) amidotransferase subunit A
VNELDRQAEHGDWPSTVTQMRAALANRAVTSAELVSHAIESIQGWQGVTNATSQLWPDEALAAARAVVPEAAGPLHGVPVLVKELFDVAGHETTGCCEAFRGNVAASDAFLVARLRDAGAIIVGKTNMHELAASATNHVSACGPTHNPWDPARLTGGSSGGSAAVVATRSVPFALGTDTAGSIRVPASFCGVVGLKPTHGRLPMRGVMPLSPTMGCAGPMAATVEDVALGYAALTGEPGHPVLADRSLAGVRIGRVREGYYSRLIHPHVRAALEHVADVLGHGGAVLVDTSLPDMDGALRTWGDIAWPEFATVYPDLDLDHVGHQIAEHYRYGRTLDPHRRARASEHAERMQTAFVAALQGVDAVLLPATGYAAPLFTDDEIAVGDGESLNVFRGGPVWFTCPMDVGKMPALSVPAGFDPSGLPIGIQLLGKFGAEWTLLRIGHAFQQLTGHHLRTPAPYPGPAAAVPISASAGFTQQQS